MQVEVYVKFMETIFDGAWLLQFWSYGSLCLPSKTAKISFQTMDYSPWSSKILIDWNWLKKFMQVGIDVKCMCTNFGRSALSGFRDIATFNNGQISLSEFGAIIKRQ